MLITILATIAVIAILIASISLIIFAITEQNNEKHQQKLHLLKKIDEAETIEEIKSLLKRLL